MWNKSTQSMKQCLKSHPCIWRSKSYSFLKSLILKHKKLHKSFTSMQRQPSAELPQLSFDQLKERKHQTTIFFACAQAAARAFTSSDRDSITNQLHCFTPALLMEMDDPPPSSIISSSSVPCTFTFNTCPLLLSPMSMCHLNHTHTHTNHPPHKFLSIPLPSPFVKIRPPSFSAHLCTPVSRLISDWAMWQAEERKAADESGSVRQPLEGHDSVCLSRFATLFSFIPPWFHRPYTSKIQPSHFLCPALSLSLSLCFFSLCCIMISLSSLRLLLTTGCSRLESWQRKEGGGNKDGGCRKG